MFERSLDNGVLTLTMAYGKVNVMDADFLEAFCAALEFGPEVNAVLLSSSTRAFSAGVDLTKLVEGGRDYVQSFVPLLDASCRKLFEVEVPVVAAINGHAIAGGAIFALAADYRIMSAGRIGVPEMLVGVPFPIGPLEVIRARLPADKAEGLIYTGKTLTPDQALSAGLIDEVAPPEELSARAQAVAKQMAAIPTQAARMTKRQLRADALRRMDEGDEYNAAVTANWMMPETIEVIRAYVARTIGK